MIYLIDKIKQKNNGSFFLVDAADVEYDGDSLETALENLSSGTGTSVDIATDEEVTEALDDVFGTTTSEEDTEEDAEEVTEETNEEQTAQDQETE